MIEMLGVLAIIGVLSAGGIMGYSAAMENYNVNKFIDIVQQTAANTAATFTKIHTGERITLYLEDLYRAGIVPKDLYDKKTNATYTKAPMGGFWYIDAATGAAETFPLAKGGSQTLIHSSYIYHNIMEIPKSVCVKLATHDWSGNGTLTPAFKLTRPTTEWYIKPLTVSEAQSLCTNNFAVVIPFLGRETFTAPASP